MLWLSLDLDSRAGPPLPPSLLMECRHLKKLEAYEFASGVPLESLLSVHQNLEELVIP